MLDLLRTVPVRPRTCAALLATVIATAPAHAATIAVHAGGDLQSAIDSAQPGDTLLLDPGATFTGNFVLPLKTGADYITIRSAAPDPLLPAATERMGPSFASLLPKIRSGNSSAALATAAAAHHYRLQFLEFLANSQGIGDIIQLGDGSAAQNTLNMVPHDLIVDRVYVHGDAANGQKRGIALNSASTTIVNSHISDIKAAGQDSQAICGWNGPGPFTIANNYLEAAGENVLFGGADPSIPLLVPSDISVTRNYMTKQTAWRSQGWSVKNLFELKNAQRVVVDGNLLEYNWQAAQPGYAVLFTPRNQDGTAPWTVVQQVEFTNNVIRHVSSGFNILGSDNVNPSQVTTGLTIRNNLLTDISSAAWGGSGRFLQINGGASITIDHNTAILDGNSAVYAYGGPTSAFTFTNNIVPDNNWAFMGDNASPGNNTIATYFPGIDMRGNVIAAAPAWLYPAGNYFPTSLSAAGFVDAAGGNYALAVNSGFARAATDGTAVGVDLSAIGVAAVAGPWIFCPVIAPTSATGQAASLTFAPAIATGGLAPLTITCDPVSGSLMTVGSHTVTCAATDSLLRVTSCSAIGVVTAAAPQQTPTAPPSPPASVATAPPPATTADPTPSSDPQPAIEPQPTGPVYEVPPAPGAYGFTDHGYYRPTGGWQETRLIAPAAGPAVTYGAVSTVTTSTPVYELPAPAGAYGFNDHGYYRPTGGWQETRMIAPGVTTTVTHVAVQNRVAAGSSSAPNYQIAAPAGAYGFTNHGYFRPDGGWQETPMLGTSSGGGSKNAVAFGEGASAVPAEAAAAIVPAVTSPAAAIAGAGMTQIPATVSSAATAVTPVTPVAASAVPPRSIDATPVRSAGESPQPIEMVITPAPARATRIVVVQSVPDAVAAATVAPVPADATVVGAIGALEWTPRAGASFDVYFGTSSQPPRFASGLADAFVPLPELAAETTYFWRVVMRDSTGETTSRVFSFSTGPLR